MNIVTLGYKSKYRKQSRWQRIKSWALSQPNQFELFLFHASIICGMIAFVQFVIALLINLSMGAI